MVCQLHYLFRMKTKSALNLFKKSSLLVIFTAACHLLAGSLAFAAESRVPEHLMYEGKPPRQLTPNAMAFVKAELSFNPVREEAPVPFKIEHIELPLAAVTEDAGIGLDPEIRKAMTFKGADNIEYLRWVMNPQDTQYNAEMMAELKKRSIPFSVKNHFIGYLTSSRSCIVQDPVSGAIFSIKGSTNMTAGAWADKKEPVRIAKAGRLLSDYLSRNFNAGENKNLRFIPETLAFYFMPSDQAIIIRQYDTFKQGSNKVLIPAFTALHKKEGARLAGGQNPISFWGEHFAKPTYHALSQLALNYGIIYNSAHGQNFLLEYEDGRLTGRIYARDYIDADLQGEVFRARGEQKALALYSTFTQNKVKEIPKDYGYLTVSASLTHMPINGPKNMPSTWMKSVDDKYYEIKEWIEKFPEVYRQEVAEKLKVNIDPSPSESRAQFSEKQTVKKYGPHVLIGVKLSGAPLDKWLDHLSATSTFSCSGIFAN